MFEDACEDAPLTRYPPYIAEMAVVSLKERVMTRMYKWDLSFTGFSGASGVLNFLFPRAASELALTDEGVGDLAHEWYRKAINGAPLGDEVAMWISDALARTLMDVLTTQGKRKTHTETHTRRHRRSKKWRSTNPSFVAEVGAGP